MYKIKYPEISVKLVNEDGNALAIVARVRTALKQYGVPSDLIEKFTNEALSGDYVQVLTTVMEWVRVK